MPKMTIGQRIRKRRLELGLSQEELAWRLGNKSRASVCTVEKDKEDLTTTRISQYAEALETTPAYIMGWEDEQGHPIESIQERLKKYNETDIIKALDILDALDKTSPDARAMIDGLLKSHQSDP